MPSSKGNPTDPKLREQVKKDVMQMEKGGGKGQWSAWKAGELARQYEARGGGYEDTGDNPNKAEKGDPKPKQSAVMKGERKSKEAPVGETKKESAKKANSGKAKTTTTKKTKSSASSSQSSKKSTAAAKSSTSKPKGRAASTRKAASASA